MKRKIVIPYNQKLKELARHLRKSSTLSEVLLWRYLKRKQMLGYDFDRQKPIDNYIVDFYCSELGLIVEVDGKSHSYLNDTSRPNATTIFHTKLAKRHGFNIYRINLIFSTKNTLILSFRNMIIKKLCFCIKNERLLSVTSCTYSFIIKIIIINYLNLN